jgi:ATP-dependent DNA helicase RecG
MTKLRYHEAESSTVELKSSTPKNDQIVKTMIAFCNHHGGKLVVGVEDDRTVIGVPEQQLDDTLQWIEKSVYEASFPSIIPRVSTQRIGVNDSRRKTYSYV